MSSPPTTPATTPAEAVRSDLRRRLIAARSSRDATSVAAVRVAIAAIDNAEAPAAPGPSHSESAHIVGSALGLGTTEVDRVHLSEDDVLAIIRQEIDERTSYAAEYEQLGEPDPAAELRAQADVLEAIVAERLR